MGWLVTNTRRHYSVWRCGVCVFVDDIGVYVCVCEW